MSRTSEYSVYDPLCPARQVLDHLTSRWGVLVLDALRKRPYRFNELRRLLVGVSDKVLAQTLQTLERDRVVRRTEYPEVPPRVEYRLTELGAAAAELVSGLVAWVEQHTPEIVDPA